MDKAGRSQPVDKTHAAEIQRLRQALARHQRERQQQQEALRKIAQELQASREAYQTLYDQFPQGYFTLDEKGVIIEANFPGAELLGVPRDVLIARPLSAFILSEDHKVFQMHLAQTLEAKTQQTCELRMIRQEADKIHPAEFHAQLISTVMENHNLSCPTCQKGHRRYWRTLISDITERKRTEHLILRSERLMAMGHIAASLAHEIKNPLQAIYSNLELVLDFDLDDDERQTYLHLCRQEIEHLSEITKRVLNFTRTDTDTHYAVSVSRLIQRAMALVQSPLQNTQVQITTNIPPDLPPVLVVPNQVVQVLLNLILNSIEAVHRGGQVHIMAHIDDDNRIVLTLINNGPPIPDEHLEHLFDPFFTTKTKGTGLGLFISESIMKRHGGEINIDNLPDAQGVVCTLTLPVAHFVEPADRPHPADKMHPVETLRQAQDNQADQIHLEAE